ncbi:COG4705 family protein [Subtercola sp. YIM 133946]|uniref:COG4705 family protein n=1 Tax=Subtercola sp. YIM 133946 TaxID=3118909 RepID=UPI002F91D68F
MSRLVAATRASKVPEVSVLFWVTKVLTTGMGETTSDFFAVTFDPVVVIPLTGIALVIALVVQFRATAYSPWIYWMTVVLVSVFGTMAADVAHVGLGIPYAVSTVVFAVVLAVVFVVWRLSEGTLSIHSITTRRREAFYWAAVLATFALGTAAGDLTATVFDLGYLGSGILFAVIIAVPAVAYLAFRMNAVAAFWFAYVVTRPLGASFADWMAVPPARGGLGLGTGPISLALLVLIVGCVSVLAVEHRSVRRVRR